MIAEALESKKEGPRRDVGVGVILSLSIIVIAITLFTTTFIPVLAENSSGTVSIIFGTYPQVRVLHVENWSTVNGTIEPLALVTDGDGQEDIEWVEIYANFDPCDQNGTQIFLGNATNISATNFNQSWNTTGWNESNYWKIRARAYDNLSIQMSYDTSDWSNQFFTVNNIDQEPTWANFTNNITTNFTNLTNPAFLDDWAQLTDITLEKTDVGKVAFNETLVADNADYDSHVTITPGVITVDTCGLGNPTYQDAAGTLSHYNLSLVDPQILRDNVLCTICTVVGYSHTNYTNGTYTYTILNFDSIWVDNPGVVYQVIGNQTMSAWDQNDTALPLADLTAYRNSNINFYANYTSSGGPLPNLPETNCYINIQTGNSWAGNTLMTYDTDTTFFTYTTSFAVPEDINWSVTCNSSLIGYQEFSTTGNVSVPNRQPIIVANYPDVTMFEDSSATGHDLDSYFLDPDGDTLNYTAALPGSIQISIDSGGVPTYIPDPDYSGTRTSYFTAADIYGGSVKGNDYTITVIDVPEPTLPPAPESTDSGGGGGVPPQYCEPTWECDEWGGCKFKLPSIIEEFLIGFTGYQTRVCTDAANCGYDFLKPEELRGCHYQPTCFDLIKNQGETGVDCGGPCPPCATCFDGIRNQGETGVDCGGPCPSCPTCFDGILNQGEDDIDCGGPCPKCTGVIHRDSATEEGINKWIIALMIAMILSGVTLSVYYSRPYATRLNEWLLMKMERLTEVPVPEPTLLDLELKTLAQLQQLDDRLDSGSPADLSARYAQIMRVFFEKASGLTYEFTYEELLKELRQLKVGPVTLRTLRRHFELLKEIEFSKQSLARQKLHTELTEARKQVRAVVKSLAKTEAPTRAEISKRATQRKMIREQKLVLQFNRMLLQAERALTEGQMDVAKSLYNKLRGNYQRLPEKERKDMLKRIQVLYKKIAGVRSK